MIAPMSAGRFVASILVLVMWFGAAFAEQPAPDSPKPDPQQPTEQAPPKDAPATPAQTPPTTTPPTTTPPSPATPETTPVDPNALTTVAGRITDVLGRPVSGARVYVLPRVGHPYEGKTKKDGRYSVTVKTTGTHGIVIAIDKAHTFRTVIIKRGVVNALDTELDLDTEGGEVIKIEDRKRPQPAVKPKPKHDVRQSLPYSDEAVERDAWARAWLLLDVDEAGAVTRLKLLKKPGFDLDAICITEAFRLKFDPARDGSGRPMKTYILWTMEWPAWGWLLQGNGTTVRRPADSNPVHGWSHNTPVVGYDSGGKMGGPWARPLATANAFEGALDRVPCAGSGPLNLDLRNRAYRDCSQPDMSIAEALPWITRETAATAIAELKAADLKLVVDEGPPRSRVPEYVGTAVTGAVIVGWVASYMTFRKYSQRVEDHSWQLTVDPEEYRKHESRRDKWAKISLAMTGAVVVSTGVTLFLWNRNQSRRSFSVQPTGDGAQLSFGGSFD